LIGSICGVPTWVLEEVSLDDGGEDVGVEAASEIGFVEFVGGENLFYFFEEDVLRDWIGDGSVLEGFRIDDIFWDGLFN
jgi:hypothetical protein